MAGRLELRGKGDKERVGRGNGPPMFRAINFAPMPDSNYGNVHWIVQFILYLLQLSTMLILNLASNGIMLMQLHDHILLLLLLLLLLSLWRCGVARGEDMGTCPPPIF